MQPILPDEGDNSQDTAPEHDGPFHAAIYVMQRAAEVRRDASLTRLGDALTALHEHDRDYALEMLLDWLCNEVPLYPASRF